MKVNIPEELKSDVPASRWGKILTATPVVMTVVATMLAALSSSEMTRAQYDRSLGAQLQAKAGDQWSFFQAKRLRGALQRSAIELLEATTDATGLDTQKIAKLTGQAGKATIAALEKGELPASASFRPNDSNMKVALDALEKPNSDEELAKLLPHLDNEILDKALLEAHGMSLSLDASTKPIDQEIETIGKSISGADKSLSRDFALARMRYTVARYDAEARCNQNIANLYELQVRKCNFSANRHHERSQRFFYGMLAAQLAVIISTFAIAAQKRNMLWSIAAIAGLVAIALTIYVYLFD